MNCAMNRNTRSTNVDVDVNTKSYAADDVIDPNRIVTFDSTSFCGCGSYGDGDDDDYWSENGNCHVDD